MYERELTPSIMKRMQSETCYKCGKQGHWSWYCTSPSRNTHRSMETDTCYKCGKIGHWSWYCPLKSPNYTNHGPSNMQLIKQAVIKREEKLLQQTSLNHFPEGCSSKNNTTHKNLIGSTSSNVNDLGNDGSDDDLLLKIESMTITDSKSHKEKDVADDHQLQVANLVSVEEADEPFQRDLSPAHASLAKDKASPNNKPLSSERKLISKEDKQAALFQQQSLLIDLESLHPHQLVSMIEAAETTFVHLAPSIAKIDKYMENNLTFEEHNTFIEEEKMRLACIQDESIKIEDLLEVSNQERKLLREEVSRLHYMLYEKECELESCELDIMSIEEKLVDVKTSLLEVDTILKERATQAEIARGKSIERSTMRIEAKTALEKAKLALKI